MQGTLDKVTAPDFKIRKPDPEEVPRLYMLFQDAGWTIQSGFLELYYSLQPSSFFIAATPAGDILGLCIGYRHGDTHGRITRLVTRKEYRKRGIASKLLTEALGYLEGRIIGLDAVIELKDLYVPYGFTFHDFDGICVVGVPDKMAVINYETPETDMSIHPVQEANMAAVVQYDSKVHVVSREQFLRKWIDPSRSVTLCAINKQGVVIGYLCKWMFGTGVHRIGPFYANDLTTARMLWRELVGLLPNTEKVYIRIPSRCPIALKLASSVIKNDNTGIEGYRTIGTRMYTQAEASIPYHMVYGVTECDCSII